MEIPTTTPTPTRSPLVSLAMLAPEAAWGAARAIQRAAFGVATVGVKAVVTRAEPVFASAYVRAEPMISTALERAVDLLPVEALLARVDVDALIRQVDIDALVARVDLPRIVNEVFAGIELGDLIQDSTTGIATDARDSVRVQAMNVDRRLARLVDVILRRGERDLVVPGYTLGATT